MSQKSLKEKTRSSRQSKVIHAQAKDLDFDEDFKENEHIDDFEKAEEPDGLDDLIGGSQGKKSISKKAGKDQQDMAGPD